MTFVDPNMSDPFTNIPICEKHNWQGNDCPGCQSDRMNEYAKKQSILFAEYCAEYGWHYNIEKGFWYDEDTSLERTHEQLYNQFLENQKLNGNSKKAN